MAKIGITIYGCEQDEAALFRELAPRFDAALTITNEPLSEETVNLASGNQCISISHRTPVTHAMLRALDQIGVKYISTRSTGYNHIDVDFAASLGVTVGNVVYSPDSVADYTLMLMLMAIRHAKSTLSRAAQHDFRLGEARGRELHDMTVGVIGAGRIGSAVIERLKGFGCRILAYDHDPKATVHYTSLDELLRESDIVTLHAPLTPETHHLLSRQRIEQMKPGAFIVNTGRGPLIDTEALIAGLTDGKLGGAALDVLEGEGGIFYADYRTKNIENDWLLQLQAMPNVLITPHTAYYTDHALRDTIKNTLINCLEFEKEKAS